MMELIENKRSRHILIDTFCRFVSQSAHQLESFLGRALTPIAPAITLIN